MCCQVLDWMVVVVFVAQSVIWYHLEFMLVAHKQSRIADTALGVCSIISNVSNFITVDVLFSWYPQDYALLLPSEGSLVSQDDFISIISGMTEHAIWSKFVLQLGSVNLILLLLRILQMCQKHPALAFITKTLAKSLDNLVPFGILFVLFIVSFSFAGTFLFGQTDGDFVAMELAVIKMWNMLLGDFDTGM